MRTSLQIPQTAIYITDGNLSLPLAHTSLLHLDWRGLTLIPLISPASHCRGSQVLHSGCDGAAGRYGTADSAAATWDGTVCHNPLSEAISWGRRRAQHTEPTPSGDSQHQWVKLRVAICGVPETNGSPRKGPPSYWLPQEGTPPPTFPPPLLPPLCISGWAFPPTNSCAHAAESTKTAENKPQGENQNQLFIRLFLLG